jgi:hypothetical protein
MQCAVNNYVMVISHLNLKAGKWPIPRKLQVKLFAFGFFAENASEWMHDGQTSLCMSVFLSEFFVLGMTQ